MKKLLIGFMSLILVLAVSANEKEAKTNSDTDSGATVAMTGTITDSQSGELLAGVEVSLEGTDTKTYTDFDGNFRFQNITPGEYKVVTNYISYNKATETLKVDGKDNRVQIKLENSK